MPHRIIRTHGFAIVALTIGACAARSVLLDALDLLIALIRKYYGV